MQLLQRLQAFAHLGAFDPARWQAIAGDLWPKVVTVLGRGGRFRYLDEAGQPTEAWPANPNGSARGVAGVTDATGRILGLMPHPDAFLYPWHHPDWPRQRARLEREEPAGLRLFRAGVTAP